MNRATRVLLAALLLMLGAVVVVSAQEVTVEPPIDLTVGLEGLNGTGVIVLVPLTRRAFLQNRTLPNWDAELPRLRPVFMEIKALASPRDLLMTQLFRPGTVPAPPREDEEPWRQLLRDAQGQQLLWYVRRRHLPIPSNIAGTPVNADSITDADPRRFLSLVGEDATLAERIGRIRAIEAPEVNTLTLRLTETRFVENPALLRSLVASAAGAEGTTPTTETVVRALAVTTDPALGAGLTLLTEENAALARTLTTDRLVESGTLPEVDRLVRDVPVERVPELATELRTAVRAGEDITANLADLRRRFVINP